MNGIMTALLYGGLVSYAGLVLINLNHREEIKILRKKLKDADKKTLSHKKKCIDLIDLKNKVEKEKQILLEKIAEYIKVEAKSNICIGEKEVKIAELEEIIEFDNDLLTEKTKIIERLTASVEYHKKSASFLRWSNKNIRTKFSKVRFIQLEKACKL